MPEWLPIILGTVIMQLPIYYVTFFRQPRRDVVSARKELAEAKKTEEEASSLAIDRAERYEKKLQEMDGRLFALEKENKELRAQLVTIQEENACLRGENGELRDWAERLINQVVSLGGTPVFIKKKGKGNGI